MLIPANAKSLLDIKYYEKNGAKIIDIHEDYYIVKYKDVHFNWAALGFKENSLELMKELTVKELNKHYSEEFYGQKI